MTDVLTEFPELKDPRSGEPLMRRSVLIANTSNMPVAAREASVYTGITIAEYFRDMGYTVALMADSTSRWAEAMREISTRLEEMPAEEGYPAYLAARIAVSPPGGDLSDSVVQATLHVVKVFWSLKGELAYQRHFPAIDWLTSYSFYKQYLKGCFEDKELGDEMERMTVEAMGLLEQEAELLEIVRLVGAEALSPEFHKIDTYTSMEKQYEMLKMVLHFHKQSLSAIAAGVDTSEIFKLAVREDIARAKYIPEAEMNKIAGIRETIDEQIRQLQGSAVS